MAEKKADKPRYWVTYLLPHLPVGAHFNPGELHLTILPWFVTEIGDKKVVNSFYEWFKNQPAFDITVGRAKEFKHKRTIPVNLVQDSPELLNLHKMAMDWFKWLAARWAVKTPYVEDEFMPHIRRRPGHNLSQGDTLHIGSLSLVRAHRRGDELRTVAAKVELV